VIGIAPGKDLGLGLKPAKGAGMNHSIAITLKIVAVRMRGLGIAPPTRVLHMNGIGSQRKAVSHQPSAFRKA
jgi:hypothetical protein